MTKDEVLRLALDVLEDINKLSIGERAIALPAEIDTAMDAIKQALEQPEPEPVAFVSDLTPQKRNDFINDGFDATDPLYTAPPKREPLTSKQVVQAFLEMPMPQRYSDTFMEGVRFAEAAHGIGEKK
jgi:hypothetical protein